MTGVAVAVGDVVQLDPESELAKKYGGPLLLIVSEVKAWGIQGYFFCVTHAGQIGPAYLRVRNGTFERVGPATWTFA